MIDDDTLLGYALNALEPAELEKVRTQLLSDTAATVNLARIQAILKPLEVDREYPPPPANLVADTLAKLDIVPKPRGGAATGKWLEFALAASIGLLGFGIVATGIYKLRDDSRRFACQNNLRAIYAGLNSYADTNNDKYPQVGSTTAPTAGHFHPLLADSGRWPEGIQPRCVDTVPVGYAYSLGHRDAAGTLIGPNRKCAYAATMPIVGDLPSRTVNTLGAVSPHGRGQNVLFTDGHAAYTLRPDVGPNGDHIYLNDKGEPHAGLHANDTVLGRPGDVP